MYRSWARNCRWKAYRSSSMPNVLRRPAGDRPGKQGGLCGCTPRIAVRPARQFFGPRWVAVGDASVVRLYKDGIGSAFYTAQRAMTTAVEQGISQRAFAAAYAPFLPQHCARQPLWPDAVPHLVAYTAHAGAAARLDLRHSPVNRPCRPNSGFISASCGGCLPAKKPIVRFSGSPSAPRPPSRC